MPTYPADFPDTCPLCGGADTGPYASDSSRAYRTCRDCSLVYVPDPCHVSAAREKAEYDLHQNHTEDPGYRNFLNRLCHPLQARLPAGAAGLDFGCGPAPALAAMLTERGYRVDIHDKYYAPGDRVFDKKYDFITATEVLEHLRRPGFELSRLHGLLRGDGILAVMTKLVRDRQAFEKWHYKNDPTHISFFSRATFEWLGRSWQARVEFIGADVILIYKGGVS